MTNPNHAHITVLADRTGSMRPVAAEASVAINTFIAEQAAVQGKTASVLLIDFDAGDPHHVVFDGDVTDCPEFTIQPRGMTPLFDAMGRAIVATGERLAAMAEDDRPSQVFFVVATDGQENSSHEWRLDALKDLIVEHEQTYAWEFVFLAQGLDAMTQAEAFSGTGMHTNNLLRSTANNGHTNAASYAHVAKGMAASRVTGQSMSYGGTVADDGTVTADGT